MSDLKWSTSFLLPNPQHDPDPITSVQPNPSTEQDLPYTRDKGQRNAENYRKYLEEELQSQLGVLRDKLDALSKLIRNDETRSGQITSPNTISYTVGVPQTWQDLKVAVAGDDLALTVDAREDDVVVAGLSISMYCSAGTNPVIELKVSEGSSTVAWGRQRFTSLNAEETVTIVGLIRGVSAGSITIKGELWIEAVSTTAVQYGTGAGRARLWYVLTRDSFINW